jgi:hypothetical protein
MDVRLCFECGIVEFYEFNDDGDPQRYAKQDFDRMFPQLAKLAKEAFPEDKDIQAIKER